MIGSSCPIVSFDYYLSMKGFVFGRWEFPGFEDSFFCCRKSQKTIAQVETSRFVCLFDCQRISLTDNVYLKLNI
jgi:hypothetical protein